MEGMTPDQRKGFIKRRVEQILAAYDEFSNIINSMTTIERHIYVHRRVEADLVTFDEVNDRAYVYVQFREATWKWLTLVDAIVFMSLLALMYEDTKHLVPLALVATVLAVSRLANWKLLKQSRGILDLLYRMYSRIANTAALEFLVDEIGESFGKSPPVDRSVNSIETEADYQSALQEIASLKDAKSGAPEGDRLKELLELVQGYKLISADWSDDDD